MKNEKTTRKKKRIVPALLTIALTFSVALAGTFAWRSVSQQALNESKGSLNPGARLHDDFNGINLSSTQTTDDGAAERKVKYVYVENFTDADAQTEVYARIRLDEYLELGSGAGKATTDPAKQAEPLVPGATIENKTSWTPYKWDGDQTFRDYVTLSTGGDTVYMPTFYKDLDSLEADINGTLGGLDKDIETMEDDYSDYVKYTYDAAGVNTSTVNDIEIYDAEGDGLDKVKEVGLNVETIIAAVKDPASGKFNVAPNAPSITINGATYTVTKMEPETIADSEDITAIYVDLDPMTMGVDPQADIVLKTAEHTARMTQKTEDAYSQAATPGILSMAEWKALPQEKRIGKYWVYDSEGWLYWAEPIEPDTATGCLLNGIAINDTTPEGEQLAVTEYYYGLNVVAQFATAGDWGESADKTGFYKDGLTPEGEALLDKISGTEDPEKIYQVEITMNETGQSVEKGSSVQFNIKINNQNTGETITDPTAVSWAVEKDLTMLEKLRNLKSASTQIDENGLLTVADEETAKTLTVIATYNYDPSNVAKTVEGRTTLEVTGKSTYAMGTISAVGAAEPGKTVQYSTTVTRTNAEGVADAPISSGKGSGITWELTGEPSDETTKIDPETGVLTIGNDETNGTLSVKASYKGETSTKEVGTILTTKYEIEVSREESYTEDLVQGDTVTYCAKVKKMNGSQKENYVENPVVAWSTEGSASGVTSAKAASSDNTVAKQTLTIGDSAVGIAKLTAAYSGATTVEAYQKTIVEAAYEIADFSVGATTLNPGESTDITLTVNQTNGKGAPKQVASGANANGITWEYNSERSDIENTIVSDGKLKISGTEMASSITITPTYTAANGKTASVEGKKVKLDNIDEIMSRIKDATIGEKVTIGKEEFYKVHEKEGKVLLWAVSTDAGFTSYEFGNTNASYSCNWSNSFRRSYLSENGTYLKSRLMLQKMINAGKIEKTTLYTQIGAGAEETEDYIFLLTEADLTGYITTKAAENTKEAVTDTRYYVMGEQLSGITETMMSDSSASVNSWLREWTNYNKYPAAGYLTKTGTIGYQSNGWYACQLAGKGVRPAFVVTLD